jgi:hypothetical protein
MDFGFDAIGFVACTLRGLAADFLRAAGFAFAFDVVPDFIAMDMSVL